MIVTFRIDERLIHGQVIATWLKTLRITHLVVANDEAAGDKLRQSALKLAVPAEVKCLIRTVNSAAEILNDPRCNEMRIMLITGSPQDAVCILSMISGVDKINLANYGSITKPNVKNKITISGMVYLDQDDSAAVNQLIESGKLVYTQKTPSDSEKTLSKIN